MRRAIWAVVIAVPVIALLAIGFQHNPNAVRSQLLGHPAPSFTLRTFDGKRISMAQLRGRPVVVNFWASWCQECKTEHPSLLRAWHVYGHRGVTFVGIAYQDGESAARSFLKKYGGGWMQLADPNQNTAINFGVSGVPETYFIDRRGIVRSWSMGPVTWPVIQRDIRGIMA